MMNSPVLMLARALALPLVLAAIGCTYEVGHGKISTVVVEKKLDLSRIPATAQPESTQFSMDQMANLFSDEDAAKYDKKYGSEVAAVEEAQLLLTELSVTDALGRPIPDAVLTIAVAKVPLVLGEKVPLPGPLTGQMKAAIMAHTALSEPVELVLTVPPAATHESLVARAVVQPIVVVNGLDAIQ